jgi:hypothetical protein
MKLSHLSLRLLTNERGSRYQDRAQTLWKIYGLATFVRIPCLWRLSRIAC